jgi:hypothetical protein
VSNRQKNINEVPAMRKTRNSRNRDATAAGRYQRNRFTNLNAMSKKETIDAGVAGLYIE